MTLKIFHNELDASDCTEHSYNCLLTEWLQVREQYPNARLYKDVICVQNDITPKTKADAWALKDVTGEYQVLCHAGDPITLGIAAAVLSVGVAVYTYINMPDVNSPQDTSGSPNNRLAQRQNKPRVNERVPDVYGKVKSIPDLISSVYRYYKDNVQVEECLLSIGTGWFDINENTINEAETPINTIEGASISIYEPNQSIVSDTPQIKIGAAFDDLPLVTKQVSSIDGKQILKSPSGGFGDARGVVFTSPNIVTRIGANFTKEFESGQKINIRNAIFGVAEDRGVSGNTDVDIDEGILTIASTININNPNDYRKLRILSLLVDDEDGGSLNLAGEYPVESITKSGSVGAWVYEATLSNGYKDVNPSFYLLTKNTVGVTSGVLTGNTNNIDLSGEYTISSLTDEELTLVNPNSVNSDWDRIGEITPQQANAFLNQKVSFISSKDNFVGWYYAGNKDSTGFILNFLAQNGIHQNELPKQVGIVVEYQMVINSEPTGEIYEYGDTMRGVGNNRNPIGQTIKKELPTTGKFRFRVRRSNDNRDYMGRDDSLIDDVTFESAYSYYETTKSVYEYDTVSRLRRMAIGSGTNASEFNMIVWRKLDTPNGFMATSDFADISTAMALDPYIGRMAPSEVDSESFYELSSEIESYFGTHKACEFNYTFDDKNSSYQEMIFTVAESVFCTARREGGLHFFNFERETANSLALFNHRNIQPESMAVTEFFGVQDNYDGIEFKWRDPDDNYGEAIIKLPDDLRTNYKTIKSQGVTNYTQAHFLANRAWNKLRYNRKAIEATVYGEGDLVTRMDRIAVVDSTVPILCSGQVDLQENTILTLDYPAVLDEAKSYVVHLQLKNSTVDVIDIVGQIGDYQIEVARIPMMPLVTDGVAHAVFNITEATEIEADAYLIVEKSAKGLFESTISAMSYDKRYYQNDKDFKDDAPVVPVFNPTDLFVGAREGGTYDPSNLSSMFTDITMEVPVTKHGDRVAVMMDLSGNGNHAVQPNESKRPTYGTDGVLHWIERGNGDNTLYIPNSKNSFKFMTNGSGGSVSLAVMVANESIGYLQFIASEAANSSESGFSLTYDNRMGRYGDHSLIFAVNKGVGGRGVFDLRSHKIVTPLKPQVINASFERNKLDTDAALSVDGVVESIQAASAPLDVDSTHDLTIFGVYNEGLVNARIYGLVMIDDTLRGDEVSDLDRYLAEKSGATL